MANSEASTGVWKIPTGVVDEVHTPHPNEGYLHDQIANFFLPSVDLFDPQGEDIFAAAVREVKEETGARESAFLSQNKLIL